MIDLRYVCNKLLREFYATSPYIIQGVYSSGNLEKPGKCREFFLVGKIWKTPEIFFRLREFFEASFHFYIFQVLDKLNTIKY